MAGAAAQKSTKAKSGFDRILREADRLAARGELMRAFSVYETALMAHPGDVGLLSATGDFARRWGMLEEALKIYEHALGIRPLDIDLMNKRGLCLHHLGRFDQAIEVFRTAIEMESGLPELWSNLGITCAEAGDADNAFIFLQEALRLQPQHPSSHANLGEVFARLGETEKAETHIKKALKSLPDDAQAQFNLASVTLRKGDLKRGWNLYEVRLDPRIPTAAIYTHGLPRWDGKPTRPGELLICQEQGLGDQIMFCTMLGDIQRIAPNPVLEIQDRMVGIMRRSWPGVTVRPQVKDVQFGKGIYRYPWLKDLPVKPRWWVPMGSLAKHLRPDHNSFPPENPYLKPDPARAAEFRKRLDALGPEMKIGFCWRSKNLAAKRLKNYLSLDRYGPILKTRGVTFINLQYDECSAELKQIEEMHGVKVVNFEDLDQFNDLEGVAALISQLDMVISAPTVQRTFAGAMGIPTLLMAVTRLWTALGADEREWFFPSVKMLHPDKYGDWDQAVAKAQKEIAGRLAVHG
jgi:Flp pilus assembly protein TadD